MSFKEKLLNSLSEQYKEVIALQKVFDELSEKLLQLEEELEEYTRYCIDVELDEDDDCTTLAIDDCFLKIKFNHDIDAPFISVTYGFVDETEHSIDRIYAHTLNKVFDIDREFDRYLQKAFSRLVENSGSNEG